jgi:threonine synthase
MSMTTMKEDPYHYLECIGCSSRFKLTQIYTCPKCGDLLQIGYNYQSLRHKFKASMRKAGPLSVWRYKDVLPVSSRNAVSLGEGGTGLSPSVRLADGLGLDEVYFKNEGQNPTGSFKDRGMTVAITRAVELDARTVVCASTGNTSASMAAYAARAGLRAVVLIPRGKIAKGKLLQAMVHGARIEQVSGNFDQALESAREMAQKDELYLVNSLNPYRIEGQKTLAFEIWEQLRYMVRYTVPDAIIVPVGNAGNISAIWKGFWELQKFRLTNRTPRMVGIQASGAAPIAAAYARGERIVVPWKHPETSASAIRIGAPASWKKALRAVQESKGAMLTVSDSAIVRAQRLLANHEGIFAEPASSASVAGLAKAFRLRIVKPNDRIVCVITGHGLKDQKAIDAS